MKSRMHVSCGVKITDVDGKHPITGLPLMATADDEDYDEENSIRCMQSQELCAILVMADAKDSKELYYDVFRDFYDYSESLRLYGMPARDGEPALQPFLVSHPQDMKSAQTVAGRGGCCKTKIFFCHLCSCTKHELSSFRSGNLRCERCKRRNKERCYHHDVCDTTLTAKVLLDLEQEVGQYLAEYGKAFDEVQQSTKLLTDPTQATKRTDVHHIEFAYDCSDRAKKNAHSVLIAKECVLRGIPIQGKSLEEWREALLAVVEVERRIKFLRKIQKWYEEGRTTVPLVEFIEFLIPCILHLENRVGEKILTMILRWGFNAITEGTPMEYIKSMQDTFRVSVLGTPQSPSQWKLQYSKGSDGVLKIEPVSERNETVRCMMNSVDSIIEAALPNESEEMRTKLLFGCECYLSAMSILTSHKMLSDDKIEHFQGLIDAFVEVWIDLFADEGISNYVHLLASGHVHYFLKKYRCLYMYSQQGWESMNSVCTGYILQNSARGGYGTGHNGGKSYIYPLIRYLMRDLLWKTGEADRFFVQLEEKKTLHINN
jgi:hypothetical protein